ncbi:MAG: hypothetical protein WED04_08005 [Promethearchaeati archaeon SRVP18_Atabeyarchaeia-1]
MSEKALSLKIKDYLNKTTLGFKFKFIDSFCDIADEKNRVYIEVKPDHFAPAQLLHAIAKEGIKDAKYLGVADNRVVKLYSRPSFERISTFVMSFDPRLAFESNEADKPGLNEQAEKILGEPDKIIELELPTSKFLFINKDNINSIKLMTDKYRIELDHLVNWLDGVGEDDIIKVNKDGWLVNMDKPERFTNERSDERKLSELPTEYGGTHKPKHLAIKPIDASWFESLRVKHEDLAEILHELDRLLSRKKRREYGVFWTEEEIGDKVADEILGLTKPDYVVEPCVGGGSLIKNIVPQIKGAMNDISSSHIENCKKIFSGYEWKFTTLDVVNTLTDVLIKAWDVPADKKLLLYTNPPFGTTSTNVLVSKKGEMNGKLSRKQSSTVVGQEYPRVLEKYGKGDLFLPIVGRLIEIAKAHETCCLAFFSPFGLFCGRERYMKLLTALLKDFRFLKGYIFAGNYFHDISKIKPIAFTIWEYAPNTNSKHLDLSFEFVDKSGGTKKTVFKKMPLLKDGWAYDNREVIRGEIAVQHCDTFNAPAPKVFHLDVAKGGSEVVPENVKKVVGIPNVPDELFYGLWSVSVGARAFWTSMTDILHPIYFDNAYVHLPDTSRRETLEILAYSALHALFANYAKEKIGFFGTNKVFRFGGESLTKGVEYLFNLCKDCLVYDGHTIGEVVELIRQSKVDTAKCRKGMKDEVSKRLDQIGYWDYVPIP